MSGEIDLSELQFLPQWAKEPLDSNPYKDHQGDSGERPRRGGPGRRDNGPRGFRDRPQGKSGGGGAPRHDGPRGQGGPGRDRRDGNRDRDRGRRPDGRRDQRPDFANRPKPDPLPALDIQFQPEPHGLDSMIQQIKGSGRAYPVYDLARMILKKPERHQVALQFPQSKDADPASAPKFYVCALDHSVWLSEADAVQHLLAKHLETFYQPEKVTIDPPKGNFPSVGVCGMSGAVLGPPNHHDYPGAIRRLYVERFANMPFDMFKSRIKVVKDEALIQQWKDQHSSKTEYLVKSLSTESTTPPVPTEPAVSPESTESTEAAAPAEVTETAAARLGSLEAVREHFQKEHLATQIQAQSAVTLTDLSARDQSASLIQRAIRRAWDGEVRFPSKTGPNMIQALSKNGLQFFKWNKGITHVAAVRPKRFDPEKSPVADGVRTILAWVAEHPGKTRNDLLQALAPEPVAATASVPAEPAVTETAPASAPASETPAPVTAAAEPAASSAALAASTVLSDLHWLLHEGFVVEFANNQLDLLRQNEKPQNPGKKAAAAEEKTAATPSAEAAPEPATAPAEEPVAETPTEDPKPPAATA